MENKHIEYLANEYLKRSDSYDPQTIRQFIKDRTIKYFDSSEALSALQALETAMTEKHRAEVEALKAQIQRMEESMKRYRGDNLID